MKPVALQNVRGILAELEEEPRYKMLRDSPDTRAQVFRQSVDRLGIRCLTVGPEAPSEREIEDSLQMLISLCTGRLAEFQRFAVRALDGFHAP
jgi:hypothetical protein